MKKLKHIYRAVKPFILPVVLVLMGWALWGMREQVLELLSGANPVYIIIAFAIAVLYLPVNASIWGVILQSLGVKVSRWRAGATWLRCEALRWLPGSFWGYASRAGEAKNLGGTKLIGGLSLTFELSVTVISWGILAVIGLGFTGFIFELFERVPQSIKTAIIICSAVGVSFVLISPILWKIAPQSIKTKLGGQYQKGRENLKHPKKLGRALFEYTCLNFVYSIGFYFCFLAVCQSENIPGLLSAIGANGLAWIVGVFSVGVPGGLGVREGVTAIVFQPFSLVNEAAAAAILWRGLQLVVEMVFLAGIILKKFLSKEEPNQESFEVPTQNSLPVPYGSHGNAHSHGPKEIRPMNKPDTLAGSSCE
ncbi:MAG: lysylphosphatidylglycerol synthase transmembrane domain-containing protein [Verrucomicrobiota bacterium]